MTMNKRTIEVCCQSIADVREAVAGGASRVELCKDLSLDGITPSHEDILEAVRICGTSMVNVLIRPRGGDFVYDDAEVKSMLDDIDFCRSAGVNAVVIGALTPEGDIDLSTCRNLVAAARGLHITFHRAFDVCKDPLSALEDIISLGCDRLLTSGQGKTALEGVSLLEKLVLKSASRLTILVGGGVRPSNIEELEKRTGALEFHSSAREAGAADRKVVEALVGIGK